MSLRHITSLAVTILSGLGWISGTFMAPPPVLSDPEPDPLESPHTTAAGPERTRPRMGRETISGAPLTPVERELWADLLDQ
jgi:hypothetical protein